ncbi:TylF/MycF/NovP-related O-methyltransferase [Candidatus Galacturonibacter soehngenii]|uniref:Macrocin-O-methyltransferase n=1 Tax=Candidatus Galacturonatibacter soehngenii TaxID=2307010 RepID=A0A7V7QL85_9FIRM|nr:TylF/MycF/NovP-related O-methyltransferase [Candidatus Galacturonibacter soehngenii]KAB1438647.1 macrocin-O-methyltransferase [Candidatus Galacturonibacter soehngenii]
MKKVIIFGTGSTGLKSYNQNKEKFNIIYFVDNDRRKWGSVIIDGIQCIPPSNLIATEFDYILIGSVSVSEIKTQLLKMGISNSMLLDEGRTNSEEARISWLKRYSELVMKNEIKGCVAEAGVYRGEFAKWINYYFYDRKCYLFDTFEGFDNQDIKFEEGAAKVAKAEHLKDTSVELVLGKMRFKEQCIVKKGYFPESALEVNEMFTFVNLDLDLYKPTLEGLRFFYPKLVDNGIIVIHDYFNPEWPNVKKAVEYYEKEIGQSLKLFPIGDDISIGVIK